MDFDEERALHKLDELIAQRFGKQSAYYTDFSSWLLQLFLLKEKQKSAIGLSPSDEFEWRRIINGINRLAVTLVGLSLIDLGTQDSSVLSSAVVSSPGHSNKCFISYASDDYLRYVEPFCVELQQREVAFWLDKNEIPLGRYWDVAIDQALRESPVLILCVTPRSLAEDRVNVRVEWRYVIDLGKTVIPVVFENISTWPAHLASLQRADFTDRSQWDRSLEALVLRLRSIIGY